MGWLPTLMPNVVHHALNLGFEVLGDASVGENSQIDKFEEIKKK